MFLNFWKGSNRGWHPPLSFVVFFLCSHPRSFHVESFVLCVWQTPRHDLFVTCDLKAKILYLQSFLWKGVSLGHVGEVKT
jgi:hypothetical protein